MDTRRNGDMRHGWLKVNGQTGDRSLEEQIEALKPAIASCSGKTLLDLGCAEGLIAREFIRAGAKSALCIDAVEDHLKVARKECEGLPMKFMQVDLGTIAGKMTFPADIVLCLGIAHKVKSPETVIRLAANSARKMVLMRSGLAADENGIIRAKHFKKSFCDSHAVLKECGFKLDKTVMGPEPHNETVEYWLR